MDAAAYDAWYRTPRGAWIGDVEYALLRKALAPEPGERLLDVGCGTGYFTRRFAGESRLRVVGLDRDARWLEFARAHDAGDGHYCLGRAETLPFADAAFDLAVSVAALCFVDDARRAIEEIVRVTRRRFAVGLLNRRSLLYRQKGRAGGTGAYRGAHWHTTGEVRELFRGLPVGEIEVRCAVFLPAGGAVARGFERILPGRLPLGAFLMAAGARPGSMAPEAAGVGAR